MKVINLFAGPGAGKSTTAAGIFYQLKMKHVRVEIVPEFAKDLAYSDQFNLLTGDQYQISIFAEQNRRQLILRNKVDWAIAECPLLLSSVYGTEELDSYHDFVVETFQSYDNINFYLERPPGYQTEGRYQDFEGAKKIDDSTKALLKMFKIPVIHIQVDQHTVGNILSHLNL